MKEEELDTLAKQIINELQQTIPKAVAGTRLPTIEIIAACCEENCPCNTKGNGGCTCQSKCQCEGHTALTDPIDFIGLLSKLPQEQIKTVLEAAPIIRRVRLGEHPEEPKS